MTTARFFGQSRPGSELLQPVSTVIEFEAPRHLDRPKAPLGVRRPTLGARGRAHRRPAALAKLDDMEQVVQCGGLPNRVKRTGRNAADRARGQGRRVPQLTGVDHIEFLRAKGLASRSALRIGEVEDAAAVGHRCGQVGFEQPVAIERGSADSRLAGHLRLADPFDWHRLAHRYDSAGEGEAGDENGKASDQGWLRSAKSGQGMLGTIDAPSTTNAWSLHACKRRNGRSLKR